MFKEISDLWDKRTLADEEDIEDMCMQYVMSPDSLWNSIDRKKAKNSIHKYVKYLLSLKKKYVDVKHIIVISIDDTTLSLIEKLSGTSNNGFFDVYDMHTAVEPFIPGTYYLSKILDSLRYIHHKKGIAIDKVDMMTALSSGVKSLTSGMYRVSGTNILLVFGFIYHSKTVTHDLSGSMNKVPKKFLHKIIESISDVVKSSRGEFNDISSVHLILSPNMIEKYNESKPLFNDKLSRIFPSREEFYRDFKIMTDVTLMYNPLLSSMNSVMELVDTEKDSADDIPVIVCQDAALPVLKRNDVTVVYNGFSSRDLVRITRRNDNEVLYKVVS